MQRKRLSSVVIVAFLLLVGLLIASQYPNLFVSAEGEPQQSAETAPTTYPESEPRTVSAIPVFLDNPYQIADIAEAANPATVYIQVKWPMQDPTSRYRMSLPFGSFFDFFWGMPFSQPTQPITQGSGFIIDESGIVLTNQHVVGSAGQEQEITVTVTSPNISGDFKARILGSDAALDLAVLKIEGGAGPFPTIPLGDSDSARQGEWVIAIGNPYGRQLDHTVTFGILSAKGREIEILDPTGSTQVYKNLMQIDAAINSGNSGGPLLNIKGEVIGINTAVHTQAQGIGFAIPINVAKEVLQDLIEFGSVQRPSVQQPKPWIGFWYTDINEDIYRYFRLPDRKGILVTDIVQGSPAEKAGIKAGDVIRRFDQHDILEEKDLLNALSQYKPGDQVMITVWRSGRTLLLPLTLGAVPEELQQ